MACGRYTAASLCSRRALAKLLGLAGGQLAQQLAMLIHDAGRVGGENQFFRFQRNRRGGGDFFQRPG